MALADQHVPAGLAGTTALPKSGDLPRHESGLQRRREPFRLGEAEPELGQAGLLITHDAGDLGLADHAGLEFRDQPHPPHQVRHPPTLIP